MMLDKTQFPEDHPMHKVHSRNYIERGFYPGKDNPTLNYHRLLQNVDKTVLPSIGPSNFTEMVELDIITAQALKKGTNGLSSILREARL